MKNKIIYIAGSIHPHDPKYNRASKFTDGYAVAFEESRNKYLLTNSQLPENLDISELEKKLEDPVFLAKYYLEKEYNIKYNENI